MNSTKYSRTQRQLTQDCSLREKEDGKRAGKRAGKGKKRNATDINHGEDYAEDEDNEENEEPSGKKHLRRSPGSTAETLKLM